MRKIKIIWPLLAIMLLVSCSYRVKIKKEVFEKVDLGMTRKEVREILGEPNEIRPSVESDSNFFYYIKNVSLENDYAGIYFDKNGRVNFLHYGRID